MATGSDRPGWVARAAGRVARRLQAVLDEDPFPRAEPAEVGIDPTHLEPLRVGLARRFEERPLVGAVLHVVVRRRTVLHQSVGWMDREQRRPMVTDAICDVRSMTKPLLGTVALQLCAEGTLDLEAPVARYLPAFEKVRDVTVEQLLRHTAGFAQPGFPGSARSFSDLRAAAEAIGERGPSWEPGTRFGYSDAGSAILGAVISRTDSSPIEEVIERRVLQPLQMNDSLWRTDLAGDPRCARLASGYELRGERATRYWSPSDPPKLHYVPAAGGLWTTTRDYARFLAAWMDDLGGSGRLLDRAAARRAVTSAPLTRLPAERGNYGLHWWLYSDPADGDGAQLVFGGDGSDGTWAMAAPGPDLMVLYFTQTRGGSTMFEVMRHIRRLVEVHPSL